MASHILLRFSRKKRKPACDLTQSPAIKKKSKKRELSPEEIAAEIENAKAEGLPNGWTFSEINRHGQKIWISPTGKKCYSLSKALIVAGVKEPNRTLTSEEVAVALKDARVKGLPDNWTVEWDNKYGQKIWISPCGGEYKCLPQALMASSSSPSPSRHRSLTLHPSESSTSLRIGRKRKLTALNQKNFVIKGPKSSDSSVSSSFSRLSSSDEDGEYIKNEKKALTPTEKKIALSKAKTKGLPDDWTVEWNISRRRNIWISPDGKKCYSLTQALIMAGVKSSYRTLEERTSALANARAKGLPDGWTVEWHKTGACNKVWIAPNGKRHYGLAQALVSAGVQSSKRSLTFKEIAASLKKARSKGLPENWTVEWNNKTGRKNWVSPEGRKCNSLSDALIFAGVKEKRQLSEYELTEAIQAAKTKGLPEGWALEWNSKTGKKNWVSPTGKKCQSFSEAMFKATPL
jgi:hypothetical protein